MAGTLEKYVENTARIRELSSPKLITIINAEEYSMRLRDNFLAIGRLAAENRRILKEELEPLLEVSYRMNESELKLLSDFGDSLIDACELSNIDPSILSLVTGRLVESAKHSDSVRELLFQLDREISSCYVLLNITVRLRTRPELSAVYKNRGLAAWERMAPYLEKEAFAALPDTECRQLVLVNSRYVAVLYEGSDMQEEVSSVYAQLSRSIALADDPFYRELSGDYDWLKHKLRALDYCSMFLEYHNIRRIPEAFASLICDRVEELSSIWHGSPAQAADIVGENEMRVKLLLARHEGGRISTEEYQKELLALYARRNPGGYQLEDILLNLMLPVEYLLTLNSRNMPARQSRQLMRFYRDMLNYAFHMSDNDSLSFMLEYIAVLLHYYIEIPGGLSFEDMCLNCLAALHPPTYVHSMMVAQITRCLCRHLLKRTPSLFSALPMADNPPEILDFAYHAALCHDFGKLLIIDTIMVYGRKLLDSEFGLLKTHPETGAELLSSHESTKAYANVAMGHHLWYDGSKGYPTGFDCSGLPEKVIIDLVCCADCLDAATDTVGRSYNRGKTIDEFVLELKEGAGTRYAPYLPALFEDPALREDLEYLLSKGRRASYTRTYQRLRDLTEQSMLYGE